MDFKTCEEEGKFVIYDVVDDEERFRSILYRFMDMEKIALYSIQKTGAKKREYRYFDTFEGELIEISLSSHQGVLEQDGLSASLRKREKDSVLTIKIPVGDLHCSCKETTLRNEWELSIPSEESPFEEINLIAPCPKRIDEWQPFRLLKLITKGLPLQDVVRLSVETYRADLYSEEARKLEISFDAVRAEGTMKSNSAFYEVEIEVKDKGTKEDLEAVVSSSFFINYREYLKESTLPKWIKAIKLLRGEKLV